MLSPELIAKIRKIQFRAGHLVTEALAGEYVSAFKGQGMEFDEVREYTPGDDVRSIDWNVTARMEQPYVKVFREERELTLMLMVDVSPSQYFGTNEQSKSELAAEIAAILAFLATRNNDKVGMILFSDHVEQYIPPKKGRGHIWRIIREVLDHRGRGKKTNIAAALDYMLAMTRRRSMCFLISDFKASSFERPLSIAARRHDLVCVKIADQRELDLPDIGVAEFIDSESGERIVIDTSNKTFQTRFHNLIDQKKQDFDSFLRRQKIDLFEVVTGRDVIKPLEGFLRRRERRKR